MARSAEVIELLDSSSDSGSAENEEPLSDSSVDERVKSKKAIKYTEDASSSELSSSDSSSESSYEASQTGKTPTVFPSNRDTGNSRNRDSKATQIIDVPGESSENDVIELDSSSPLKVPSAAAELDSSPVKPTATRKLPSFRDYAYNDSKSKDTAKYKAPMPHAKIMENYQTFRKKYPHLTQKIILDALKTKDSIIEVDSYLSSLPVTVSSNSSRFNSNRLSSLNSSRVSKPLQSSNRLQSESLKLRTQREDARRKAESENIQSSKVVLKSNSSIRDRFLSKPKLKIKKKPLIAFSEEENKFSESEPEESEESEESESESGSESDSDVVEISRPSRSTRFRKTPRYEDDDDFDPIRKSRPAVARLKIKNRSTISKEREERNKRRRVLQQELLPQLDEDEDAGMDLDNRFLKLMNSADIRDIIDLSNVSPAEADVIIKNREYKTINDFNKVEIRPPKSKRSRANAKSYNETVLSTCTQKLSAYNAIDNLVKQCFGYSKEITTELVKWGVDINGQSNGELSITEIQVDDVNSDSDRSIEEEEEDHDIQFIRKSKKSWVNLTADDIDEDDDDDADFNSGATFPKARVDIHQTRDKIKYFKEAPKLLKEGVKLKDYQQVGINWLKLLYQKELSCILADEMGLGKTIQIIAFLSHLKEKKYSGPHLIVVPASTLENWLREFEKFAPTLSVIPYYGSSSEREEIRDVLISDDFDIVVTTYNILTVGKLDTPFFKSIDFNVVVYDEGHMLKNAISDRYKKLASIRSRFRVLLTGTPLQNNLKELVSLLNFILPNIFSPKMDKLSLLFDKKSTTKNDAKIEGEIYNPLLSQQAIAKAKVMMSPFILRRTKSQVMNHLPKKHTVIEYCEMSASQLYLYDKKLKELNDYRKEKERRISLSEAELKKLPKLKSNAGNALVDLRKACMHPLLFRRNYTDSVLKIMAKEIMKNESYYKANEDFIFEDMQVMSDHELTNLCHQFPNELGQFVLKKSVFMDCGKVTKMVTMLEDIIAKGEKVLIFSLFTQMLDILEVVISTKKWKFLRLDGSTSVESRQTMIDKFYTDETIPVFLLSTKAGGFGINLVCANNVIIYDQSFNPHDDKQAEDRAHRVGQTKDVFVTRLINKNSIEENILQLAFNKLQLDQSMMNKPVEDILLKTVEDVLASKEDKREPTAEPSEDDAPLTNAFESNVDAVLAKAAKESSEFQIIKSSNSPDAAASNGKRKRARVSYNEAVDKNEFLASDDGDDDYKDEPQEIIQSHSNPSPKLEKKTGAKKAKIKDATNSPMLITPSVLPSHSMSSEMKGTQYTNAPVQEIANNKEEVFLYRPFSNDDAKHNTSTSSDSVLSRLQKQKALADTIINKNSKKDTSAEELQSLTHYSDISKMVKPSFAQETASIVEKNTPPFAQQTESMQVESNQDSVMQSDAQNNINLDVKAAEE